MISFFPLNVQLAMLYSADFRYVAFLTERRESRSWLNLRMAKSRPQDALLCWARMFMLEKCCRERGRF